MNQFEKFVINKNGEEVELIKINNIPYTLAILGIDLGTFKLKFLDYYHWMSSNNPDFILPASDKSIWQTIMDENTFITIKFCNVQNFKIISFVKVSPYMNKVVNEAFSIIELGNLMTHPEWTGHGLGINNVNDGLKFIAEYYSMKGVGYWPIAVVTTWNIPSLKIFRKLVSLGLAKELDIWLAQVEHSEHGDHFLTDQDEVCFDLSPAVNMIES